MFSPVAKHIWARTSKPTTRSERLTWREIVGNKALGLALLPERWTPPFLVVGTSLYRDWSQAVDRQGIVTPAAQALNRLIVERTGWADLGLIVRSSAVKESMAHRGAYESVELTADFNEQVLCRAIESIYSGFANSGATDEIALIVQSRIYVQYRGHLSNERRVSKTSNHWMWEMEAPEHSDGRYNSQRSAAPATQHPLVCVGKKDLIELFRKIGRWCTELQEGRVHLEWGLGDDTLWLFQLDFEDEQDDDGVDPNCLLRENDNYPVAVLPAGSPIHVADFRCATGWSKIDKVKIFLEDRVAPYPTLYYLTGAEVEAALKSGRDLEADIRTVVRERAVCRADCVASGIDRLNLPRTDSVTPPEALRFMKSVLVSLTAKGAKPDEICFIFHKFIPATVAAWALHGRTSKLSLSTHFGVSQMGCSTCLTTRSNTM